MATTLAFSGGSTFTFLSAMTSEGFPLNTQRRVEEALEAAGVYGRRWRKVSQAFPVIELRTLAQADDFAAAVTLAESYLAELLAGQAATLTIAGVTLSNLHVSAVAPLPHPGPPISPETDNDTPPQAHVLAVWSIEFTAP